jgi:hypothetical protein
LLRFGRGIHRVYDVLFTSWNWCTMAIFLSDAVWKTYGIPWTILLLFLCKRSHFDWISKHRNVVFPADSFFPLRWRLWDHLEVCRNSNMHCNSTRNKVTEFQHTSSIPFFLPDNRLNAFYPFHALVFLNPSTCSGQIRPPSRLRIRLQRRGSRFRSSMENASRLSNL